MADELERVRKALRELGKTLKNLPEDPSPKAVHKLRTATRRVEAIAAVLSHGNGKESRRLLKTIEVIRKAAGDVRDMDVLAAHARKLARYSFGESLTGLLDHLKTARAQYAAGLYDAVTRNGKTARHNLKEFAKLVKPVLNRAGTSKNGRPGLPYEGVQASAMNLVRELAEWPAFDAGNIHAFRLKVKELRYTLQLDADADAALIDALTDVQRRIGDWHDWHALNEIAREVLAPERDAALLERIDKNAKRKLDRAFSAANGLRGKYLTAPLAMGA